MITEERLTKALNYLAETDEEAANLKTDVARKEYLCKVSRSKVFLTADGNNEVRKAKAETSEDVDKAETARFQAIADYETVKAKRETASLIIEVWRSENANRRAGNI